MVSQNQQTEKNGILKAPRRVLQRVDKVPKVQGLHADPLINKNEGERLQTFLSP